MPIGNTSPGGVPSGSAGGDLTGTYPNPTVAAAKITAAKMSSGAAAAGSVATADGAAGVSYAAAAGGFTIGSSYIALTSGAHAAIAMGAVQVYTWTLAFSAGTDLALNVDTQTIEFSTSGVYVISHAAIVNAGTATDLEIDIANPFDIGPGNFTMEINPVAGSLDTTVVCITTPPGHVAAPGSFTSSGFADNAAHTGTWQINSVSSGLTVIRLQ